MVYSHRVAVSREPETAEDHHSEHSDHHEHIPAGAGIAYYCPPLQVHVILAGSAIAVSLAGIGLSLRAIPKRVAVEPPPEVAADIGAALNPNLRPRVPLAAGGAISYDQPTAGRPGVYRQPVARFWLLAALLAIATALAGWWTLATRSNVWNVNDLFHQVLDPTKEGNYRRAIHGVFTAGIIVLLLTLALLTRLAVGRRIVLALFSLLLVFFLWFQVWFGSLLMMDSYAGKLFRLNGTGVEEASPPSTAPAAPTTTTAPATAPATSSTASR